MLPKFACSLRWFACIAIVLLCCFAALTATPAHAGCGGSLGINAHCGQQFRQQLSAHELHALRQLQLQQQYDLQQALKQQALKQQLRQAQLDAHHAAALSLKAQQFNGHHQQQSLRQRVFDGGANRNFTKTVTKTRSR
jgi:hypothetical protein